MYSIGTDTDLDPQETEEALVNYSNYHIKCPVLAVEVKDSRHGAHHIWSLNKLKYEILTSYVHVLGYGTCTCIDKCIRVWDMYMYRWLC